MTAVSDQKRLRSLVDAMQLVAEREERLLAQAVQRHRETSDKLAVVKRSRSVGFAGSATSLPAAAIAQWDRHCLGQISDIQREMALQKVLIESQRAKFLSAARRKLAAEALLAELT